MLCALAKNLELVKEDECDTYGSHVLQAYQQYLIDVYPQGATVADFLPDNLFIEVPSGKQGDEQTAGGHHNFGRDEIEQVKERHTEECQVMTAHTEGE